MYVTKLPILFLLWDLKMEIYFSKMVLLGKNNTGFSCVRRKKSNLFDTFDPEIGIYFDID